MTTIQYSGGQNTVLNPTGPQLRGNPTAGMEGGLNPKELIESAIGLCMSLVITGMLGRDDRLEEATALEVTVESVKADGGENRIACFKVHVKLPQGLEADYVQKLLTSAERACTIGNTVRAGAAIELSHE